MKYDVPKLAKFLYYTGAVTLYRCGAYNKDVNFVDALFRKWHPITWLVVVAYLIPCAIVGEKITDVVKTKLNSYYEKNFTKVTHKDFL